jgi:hypothetical protein
MGRVVLIIGLALFITIRFTCFLTGILDNLDHWDEKICGKLPIVFPSIRRYFIFTVSVLSESIVR